MADLKPSYLQAKGGPYDYFPSTDATQRIQPGVPQPQPFNLQVQAPPPVPSLPPLNISVAGQRAPASQQRTTSPAAPTNALPKGVPANAIPVIRGLELSYDIPGTGQRLYPTLGGGVSEFSPSERLELARYTEPAQIGADAAVRGAGIRAGADVTGARIAAESAKFRTLAELSGGTAASGQEVVPNPAGPAFPSSVVTTFSQREIDPSTGMVTGFKPIGPAAQRAAQPREGMTGTIGGRQFVVRNGQRVWTDGKP